MQTKLSNSQSMFKIINWYFVHFGWYFKPAIDAIIKHSTVVHRGYFQDYATQL